MCKIGIVADDLTGATTVGVLLAKAGVSTAAFFEEKDITEDRGHHAVVLSTDSRALPKMEAQEKVKSAVRSLKEKGATYFSKRIDTTLRGGIGAEVDAMLDELAPNTIAVMVPSMPQSNRILVGGYSLIDGVPLSTTPVANDVRTPVTESHIPTLMAEQTERKIGLIPLQVILSGKDALSQHLQKEKNNGAKIIIADAVTIEDVESIAKAVHELKWNVMAIDPGPFTEKLAVCNGFAFEENKPVNKDNRTNIYNGTVLTVAGSASSVTKTQMKTLSNKEWVTLIPVSAEQLIDRINTASLEVKRTSKKINSLKRKQAKAILLETCLSGKRLDLSEKEKELGLLQGDAANNINRGLGEIVNEILNNETFDIKGIYMTGGDTMAHILRALGAKGIELVDYVIPQADLGRIIGGKYDGLTIVGKGGLTGTTDTAVSIVERIFQESTNLGSSKALNL
ncbi:four-carbon acid sugar kinase family protein [Oceanobacillus sp. Castelsardo]|uniref:four-carbon acid sugar kinase family protein n=1 Tax=Oceanobacillus sp. Castelsardo TaxID=1851204 RepID=UPI00083889F6|nr:four-carbon acid sugar kinase family protein [Oceanobacillus sp. Castelsardo]